MTEIAARSWAARLRALTPARVGLGRAGVSQQTHEQLEFQRAHALARDAVHARLEVAALMETLRGITGDEVVCGCTLWLRIGRRICKGRTWDADWMNAAVRF